MNHLKKDFKNIRGTKLFQKLIFHMRMHKNQTTITINTAVVLGKKSLNSTLDETEKSKENVFGVNLVKIDSLVWAQEMATDIHTYRQTFLTTTFSSSWHCT